MSEEFVEKIDRNLTRMGFSDRASFIRQAAKEKLSKSGVAVSAEEVTAPSRAGKGGPKRKIIPLISDRVAAEGDDAEGLPNRLPTSYKKKR